MELPYQVRSGQVSSPNVLFRTHHEGSKLPPMSLPALHRRPCGLCGHSGLLLWLRGTAQVKTPVCSLSQCLTHLVRQVREKIWSSGFLSSRDSGLLLVTVWTLAVNYINCDILGKLSQREDGDHQSFLQSQVPSNLFILTGLALQDTIWQFDESTCFS